MNEDHELSDRDRIVYGGAGLGCAVVAVAISAYAGPLLQWAAGIVDAIKGFLVG